MLIETLHTPSDFSSALKSNKPVLVEFFQAEEFRNTSILEDLSKDEDYRDKITFYCANANDIPEEANDYVRGSGLPAYVMFVDGKKVMETQATEGAGQLKSVVATYAVSAAAVFGL